MVDISLVAAPEPSLWPEILTGLATMFVSAGAAVLGAVVAGRYTREAATQQITAANKAQRQADEAEVQGFLRAVRAELSTGIWRYEENLAGIIRQLGPEEFLTVEWPIQHNYLVVFDSNARLLGRVPDPLTRRLIIQIYTHVKGMLDSLALNSRMVAELNRSEEIAAGGHIHLAPFHQLRARNLRVLLAAYAQSLQRLDQLVLATWMELEPRLPVD